MDKLTLAPTIPGQLYTRKGFSLVPYKVSSSLIKIGILTDDPKFVWNSGCYAHQCAATGTNTNIYPISIGSFLKSKYCLVGVVTFCEFINLGVDYVIWLQVPLWLETVNIEIYEYIGNLNEAFGRNPQPGDVVLS